ncbi:hypothetical protein LOAG_12566 [Loa loa]|uniref:Secreted protein n=1 Tax=Loa loa TaxID=7209 RepID=A0A1S0TKY8_LOALO|nr:hypothetical protein LOAG_12566 [Loa loa]EFO15942.1 hypothetical protein LOAG_12566 [Loa loa]
MSTTHLLLVFLLVYSHSVRFDSIFAPLFHSMEPRLLAVLSSLISTAKTFSSYNNHCSCAKCTYREKPKEIVMRSTAKEFAVKTISVIKTHHIIQQTYITFFLYPK